MNSLEDEIFELKKVFFRFFLVFSSIFSALLLLAFKQVNISGQYIFIPVLGASPTFATQLFLSAKATLVPEGVSIVVLDPTASFVAPIVISFLVALIFSFPFGLFFFVRYLSPALHFSERKVLLTLSIPSVLLFYFGCILAYFFIIPKTFSILYSFATPMEVTPSFILGDFVSSVFFITIVVGFVFLLPVVMFAASYTGVIPKIFWKRHLSSAIVMMLVLSALVTPDGTGITMILLFVPLLVLYGIGAFLAPQQKL